MGRSSARCATTCRAPTATARRSQAGPAGGRAGGAVRRVRVLPPRDAGGLAAGGSRSRGRSGAAALATRALAGAARSARPVRRQGDGDPARVLRPDARREAAAAARGAPVRDLVRRPPLRLDLRDAGARDRAARLHPQPRPPGRRRGACGVRSGPLAARTTGRARGATTSSCSAAWPAARSTRASSPRRRARARPGWRRFRAAVLERRPVSPRRARAADDSLTVVPAADPRRELETIARGDLVAAARRRDADLRRLRGHRAGRQRAGLPAARAGGVRGGVAPAAHHRRSPPPRRAADPRRGRAPAGAAARLSGTAGSAARGDAPRRRAPLPRGRSRGLAGALRGAGDRPRRRPRRSGRELPDARSDQLGAGAAAAGAGRVSVGAAQRRGAPVRPRRRGGAAVRSAAGAGAGRARAGDHRARADRLRAMRRAAPRRRSRPTRRSCGARSPRRSSPSPATRRRRSATRSARWWTSRRSCPPSWR